MLNFTRSNRSDYTAHALINEVPVAYVICHDGIYGKRILRKFVGFKNKQVVHEVARGKFNVDVLMARAHSDYRASLRAQ